MAKVHQIHSDVKKNHKCNQCGYSFNRPSKLKTHMWFAAERSLLFVHSETILAIKLVPLESICEPTTHSGEKHFSCDQCNYSCNNAGSLKKHMRQHSGEKLFVCNKCSLTCTTSSSLRTHMLSHTGGKPFAFKKCSYTCNVHAAFSFEEAHEKASFLDDLVSLV